MSQIVLYFLHSISVLSFYIDVILTLSIVVLIIVIRIIIIIIIIIIITISIIIIVARAFDINDVKAKPGLQKCPHLSHAYCYKWGLQVNTLKMKDRVLSWHDYKIECFVYYGTPLECVKPLNYLGSDS